MENEWWKELLAQFDREVIAQFATVLAEDQADFAVQPIEVFARAITWLANLMTEGLQRLLGAPTFESIDVGIRNDTIVLFVMRMNETLPPEHPYCLSVVKYLRLDGHTGYTLAVSPRANFPWLTANTDPHSLPCSRVVVPSSLLCFPAQN